ncbi:MAG: M20/M25/M40 family metallo-hydrolase [Nocardioides sp.]
MTDTEPAGTGELSDVVEAFRALLQIPTVSYSDPAQVGQPSLRPLPLELARQFPLLHERLEVTASPTACSSAGRARSYAAPTPVVLMAHLDVVPIDPRRWQRSFSAVVVDREIWVGTLDDKGQLVAICAAVELPGPGSSPQEIWLSFGCDEEVLGAARRARGGGRAASPRSAVRAGRGRRRHTSAFPTSRRRSP